MMEETFTEEQFKSGRFDMDEPAKVMHGGLPCILVMNKVDIVDNKRKMRTLQSEIEDLARFEQIFHISCETGFGVPNLREYLMSQAKERPWVYNPHVVSEKSPVERAEECMKQAIMEKYFEELPYLIGVKVISWVPKLSGELRIDFSLDVRNKVQIGMVLGESGRILKEVRQRAT